MEWRNDVLSFSGFEYGVSKRNELVEENIHEPLSEEIANASLQELNEDESENRIIEKTVETRGKCDEKVAQFKKCEFDPMTERKIENFYFRNVEQAERKMKMLTNLKSKWSEPRQTGEEVKAKVYLKPKNHENPWKDGTIQEKEIAESRENHRKRKSCVIS